MHEIDESDAVAVLLGLNSSAVSEFLIVKDKPMKNQTHRKRLPGDRKVAKRVRSVKEKPRKREKKAKQTVEPLCKDFSVQPRVIQVCSPSKLQVDQ